MLTQKFKPVKSAWKALPMVLDAQGILLKFLNHRMTLNADH
jgi:hypothetical protein